MQGCFCHLNCTLAPAFNRSSVLVKSQMLGCCIYFGEACISWEIQIREQFLKVLQAVAWGTHLTDLCYVHEHGQRTVLTLSVWQLAPRTMKT